MDFASSSSAGPSGSSYPPESQEPSTSGSISKCNYNWQLPSHLAAIVDDGKVHPNKRLFIYNRTDPNIQLDMTAFLNCMEYEETLQPNYHYFTAVQENITPFHREQAVDWIYDVAREENCDGDVFLLAVALIDRFLSVQSILKHDIQMIAGVALFIASKLKAPHPMTASKVSYYSDNSCQVDMILQWELLIVTTLGWETESPTAFSFFDFLASRIPQIHNLRAEFQTVVQKCQRMHKLATLFPSMQCAIALYYVSNLPHQNKQLAAHIKTLLANMFQLEVNLLDSYIPMVQRCLNPAPIYTVEEPEKQEVAPIAPAPAPVAPIAPIATVAPVAPIAVTEEDTDGDDEGEEETEDVNPKDQSFDGIFTPPVEKSEEAAPEVIKVPFVFDQIPISEQTPNTPLNDSGFCSDVSSPPSSEKKRRRSSEWFEDDITPPKIFKSL